MFVLLPLLNLYLKTSDVLVAGTEARTGTQFISGTETGIQTKFFPELQLKLKQNFETTKNLMQYTV